MKISKLLKGLFLPFLIFAFVGSFCPDDTDPELCKVITKRDNLYKLSGPAATVKFRSGPAEASCQVEFSVLFGWKDLTRFSSPTQISPMEESFGGLKLTFGEETFGRTFNAPIPQKTYGDNPYNNSKGNLWTIKLVASPVVSAPDGTTFYVNIEHTILEDEDYDFFVEVQIKYSMLQ